MPDQLYRKPFDDKQWEFGQVMVIWLVVDLVELVKVVLKGGVKKKDGWVGEEVWRLLGFVAPVCVWMISVIVVECACFRDCRGLGFCTVGTVG
jgi:hypothetical protein